MHGFELLQRARRVGREHARARGLAARLRPSSTSSGGSGAGGCFRRAARRPDLRRGVEGALDGGAQPHARRRHRAAHNNTPVRCSQCGPAVGCAGVTINGRTAHQGPHREQRAAMAAAAASGRVREASRRSHQAALDRCAAAQPVRFRQILDRLGCVPRRWRIRLRRAIGRQPLRQDRHGSARQDAAPRSFLPRNDGSAAARLRDGWRTSSA